MIDILSVALCSYAVQLHSLQLSKRSAPPDRRGRPVCRAVAFLVWVGDLVWWKWHGVTETTMFKGSPPSRFKNRLWSFCFCSITARHHRLSVSDSSGHDVTASGVFKEAGGRGKNHMRQYLIHIVNDISVIPEIFIAQKKMRSTEISSSEKES